VAHLIAAAGPVGAVAAQLLGQAARPVRALLLDKSAAGNWRLGWHQDRTISVRERCDVEGFGPWSVKAGQLHVQPPHWLTERMVTLRIHIDPVDKANAPLEIVPGSHLLGRLFAEDIDRLTSTARPLRCLADAGDVWAYRTAILHASAEQRRRARRRVVQIDYCAEEFPNGLEWAPLLDAGNPSRKPATFLPSASTA
jgi:ectoine hydroxylase-related dioxygenase (phytanoyl-CoA dioxygenase family)